MGELRERMKSDLALRNYRPSTQESYLRCAHRLVEYHMMPAEDMGEEEVRTFLLYQREVRGLSASSIKVYVAAFKFLFHHTLGRTDVVKGHFTPRTQKKLPLIPSGSEVEALFRAVNSIKYLALFMTMYGAGLRVSEACRLEVTDIDSKRGLIIVREGKGGRDRYTMLSPRLLETLRAYWREERPPRPFLFPGLKPDTSLSPDSARRVLKKAVQKSGIQKRVTPHILRHTFATHLLEAGVGIRSIQVLLGHRSIRTTQLYAQVSPEHIAKVTSPLELLGTTEGQVLG